MTASELNAWTPALAEGKRAEYAFGMLLLKHMGINVTPNNIENQRAVDFRGDFVGDVKFLRSPYPSSPTPAGLPREEHLTLDVANVDKYPDHTLIIMCVDYTSAGLETQGLYFITAGKVREIIAKNPKRVYKRSQRTQKDKVLKIGISSKQDAGQVRFPEMSAKMTAQAITTAVEAMRHRDTRLAAEKDAFE
jgi:hypothetical protein